MTTVLMMCYLFFNDYCVIDLLPFLNDHSVNDVLPMPRWVLMLVYLAVPVKFLFSLQQTPAGFTFNLHLNFPSRYGFVKVATYICY